MRRREFLVRTATAAGAVWLSSKSISQGLAEQTLNQKFSASDTVTLGSTGIKTSRLAMGTGTVGTGHHSHQTGSGVQGSLRSSAERIRSRPALLRCRRFLRQSSPCCRGAEARAARQSHGPEQITGRATPTACGPISIASVKNSARTISMSA